MFASSCANNASSATSPIASPSPPWIVAVSSHCHRALLWRREAQLELECLATERRLEADASYPEEEESCLDLTRSGIQEGSDVGAASFQEVEAACSFQEEEVAVVEEVDTCLEARRLEAASFLEDVDVDDGVASSQEVASCLVAEVASSSFPAVAPCQEEPSCQEVVDDVRPANQEVAVEGLVLARTCWLTAYQVDYSMQVRSKLYPSGVGCVWALQG